MNLRRLPAIGSCIALVTWLGGAVWVNGAGSTIDSRGGQFMGFGHFSSFSKGDSGRPREIVLTSPVLLPRLAFNELIASWNMELPEGTYARVEARALYFSGPTKYYVLGLWSNDPSKHARESVPGQKDENGDVLTDTLVLTRPAERVQVRVILGSDSVERPRLKFLGLCLSGTNGNLSPLASKKEAWDTLIQVPERSQLDYPDGKVLCSPTTVSMLMAFWSEQLRRPWLEHQVPEIAAAVYDAKWKGTGNWSFNMAFAGAARGMRGYVARLSDIAELEDWIATGIPVGLSVCYDRLRGKGPGPNGHLVVCVGFTANGDPIINDPAGKPSVRRVFPRKNLSYAWAYSKNTVYLVYPEGTVVPRDWFGHWDSWTAHQLIRSE